MLELVLKKLWIFYEEMLEKEGFALLTVLCCYRCPDWVFCQIKSEFLVYKIAFPGDLR